MEVCIDGVYTRVNGVTRFKNIESITDDEVSMLVEDISHKVQRLCIKEDSSHLEETSLVIPFSTPYSVITKYCPWR